MSNTNMQGKVVIITGGNAGIGLATAKGLAAMGAGICIVSRNTQKGEQAVAEIKTATGNNQVDLLIADLASLAQVRQLAQQILDKYDRIDVLINNAGAFFSHYGETEDGFERQFAINHLAPFLLTNLLLERIKASAPARIINVASRAHYRGSMNFEDLGFKKNYDGFRRAYSQSKLANVLFTKELSRRLEGTSVTVNAVHPGVVSTSIAEKGGGLYGFLWKLVRPTMISTEKGAETSIYLASSAEVANTTGLYFDKCQPKQASEEARNKEVAKTLWQVSEKMTGLA